MSGHVGSHKCQILLEILGIKICTPCIADLFWWVLPIPNDRKL